MGLLTHAVLSAAQASVIHDPTRVDRVLSGVVPPFVAISTGIGNNGKAYAAPLIETCGAAASLVTNYITSVPGVGFVAGLAKRITVGTYHASWQWRAFGLVAVAVSVGSTVAVSTELSTRLQFALQGPYDKLEEQCQDIRSAITSVCRQAGIMKAYTVTDGHVNPSRPAIGIFPYKGGYICREDVHQDWVYVKVSEYDGKGKPVKFVPDLERQDVIMFTESVLAGAPPPNHMQNFFGHPACFGGFAIMVDGTIWGAGLFVNIEGLLVTAGHIFYQPGKLLYGKAKVLLYREENGKKVELDVSSQKQYKLFAKNGPPNTWVGTGRDLLGIEVPLSVWATLGIRKLSINDLWFKKEGTCTIYGNPTGSFQYSKGALQEDTKLADDMGLLSHTASTTEGFSGSPIFVKAPNNRMKIAGIHVCGDVQRTGFNHGANAWCLFALLKLAGRTPTTGITSLLRDCAPDVEGNPVWGKQVTESTAASSDSDAASLKTGNPEFDLAIEKLIASGKLSAPPSARKGRGWRRWIANLRALCGFNALTESYNYGEQGLPHWLRRELQQAAKQEAYELGGVDEDAGDGERFHDKAKASYEADEDERQQTGWEPASLGRRAARSERNRTGDTYRGHETHDDYRQTGDLYRSTDQARAARAAHNRAEEAQRANARALHAVATSIPIWDTMRSPTGRWADVEGESTAYNMIHLLPTAMRKTILGLPEQLKQKFWEAAIPKPVKAWWAGIGAPAREQFREMSADDRILILDSEFEGTDFPLDELLEFCTGLWIEGKEVVIALPQKVGQVPVTLQLPHHTEAPAAPSVVTPSTPAAPMEAPRPSAPALPRLEKFKLAAAAHREAKFAESRPAHKPAKARGREATGWDASKHSQSGIDNAGRIPGDPLRNNPIGWNEVMDNGRFFYNRRARRNADAAVAAKKLYADKVSEEQIRGIPRDWSGICKDQDLHPGRIAEQEELRRSYQFVLRDIAHLRLYDGVNYDCVYNSPEFAETREYVAANGVELREITEEGTDKFDPSRVMRNDGKHVVFARTAVCTRAHDKRNADSYPLSDAALEALKADGIDMSHPQTGSSYVWPAMGPDASRDSLYHQCQKINLDSNMDRTDELRTRRGFVVMPWQGAGFRDESNNLWASEADFLRYKEELAHDPRLLPIEDLNDLRDVLVTAYDEYPDSCFALLYKSAARQELENSGEPNCRSNVSEGLDECLEETYSSMEKDKASGWSAGRIPGNKGSWLSSEEGRSLLTALAVQRLILRYIAGPKLGYMRPLEMVLLGIKDPSVLFTKAEAHTAKKALAKAWRQIWTSSILDATVQSLVHRPQNKGDIRAYAQGFLNSQTIGMGHHDEGIERLGYTLDMLGEHGNIKDRDASGWDLSVCRDAIVLDAERRSYLYYIDRPDKSALADNNRLVRNLLFGQALISSAHVACIGNELWECCKFGITDSGSISTASQNSPMRQIQVKLAGATAATSCGDDLLFTGDVDESMLASFGVVTKVLEGEGENPPAGPHSFTSHRYTKEGHVWKAEFLNLHKMLAHAHFKAKTDEGNSVLGADNVAGMVHAVRHTPAALETLRRHFGRMGWWGGEAIPVGPGAESYM